MGMEEMEKGTDIFGMRKAAGRRSRTVSSVREEEHYDHYLGRTVMEMLIEGLFVRDSDNLAYLKSRVQEGRAHYESYSLEDLQVELIRQEAVFEYELIRHGVPEKSVYVLGAHCIGQIREASSKERLYDLSDEMYASFRELALGEHHERKAQVRELDMYSYIERQTTEPFSLDDMAQLFGYNRSYLCTKFKKLSGKTIRQYLTECRIEEAKVLLAMSDLSLQDIAARLQFAGQSHFQRCFRAYTGMTPGAWRREHAGEREEGAEK